MKKIYFATGVLLISMCMLLACENKNASQGDSKKQSSQNKQLKLPKMQKLPPQKMANILKVMT